MLFAFGITCIVRHCGSDFIGSYYWLCGFPNCIISSFTLELSNTDIFPDVIVGLSVHCALSSRLLVERLVLNFPEKWCDVYERLLERISAIKDSFDQKQSTRCLAMLHHLLTFVPDTNGLLNKCVSTTPDLYCLFFVVYHRQTLL